MPYSNLRLLLERLFTRLNTNNLVQSPSEVWEQYQTEILELLMFEKLFPEFTNLGNGIQSPKALETARILQNLRQRFDATGRENPLVGRIRAEVVEKQRPIRNIHRNTITGDAGNIVRLTPTSFTHFSRFQVEGWEQVQETIDNQEGIVVVAPTGSGKTEVFLMPVIYAIAQSICQNPANPHRFILLYPRVALLKDQLARIFRYIHYAEQSVLTTGQLSLFGTQSIEQGIIIGFQFGGICANATDTLDNRDIFEENGTFKIVDQCPICNQGQLIVDRDRRRNRSRNLPNGVMLLYCNNPSCGNGSNFRVSIGKNDHARTRPHILVTTAESLDRLYLNPKQDFQNYLQQITGIVFDEVHLYYSIYGVHISNLVRRLEELQNSRCLVKIASSATISDPERFISNLFYGNPTHPLRVHDASTYEQEPNGLEVLYFLQSPEGRINSGAAPTLIQSVMAMGHGVLAEEERAIVFSDSLDMAGRLAAQIKDAEEKKRLWEFRVISDEIQFQNFTCNTISNECPIYLAGECWRGILANQNCIQQIQGLRVNPLQVLSVSSKQHNDYREGDIVVATPTLEVGIDDERIKSTIHYLPPRTVFSFIQKRGRAGRASDEIAYTLMVLDTTPSSQFYFYRRNRLINGNYELPLNPQNEVVRGMHDLIQRERQRMVQCFQEAGDNAIQGIWRWVWETLNRCSILRRYYARQLASLNTSPRQASDQANVRRIFREWVQQEKQLLGNYLSLERLLEEIREEIPQELHHTVQEIITAVNQFLSTHDITVNEVRQKFRALDIELGSVYYSDETDQELLEKINYIQRKVREIWLTLSRQDNWGIELRHAECLYDFFRTIEKVSSDYKILSMAADSFKIVMQAMFYLHIGLNEEDEPEGCQSHIEYYIPDAYFLSVKPIIVEVRDRFDTHSEPNLNQENVTELSTTFIPYKPVYRYQPAPYLSIVDTEHHPTWVSDDKQTVTIRLRSEGITRGGVKFPKKVYAKSLLSDEQGQQIVKLCPQCYGIYSINRSRCSCHQTLQKVKLYAEPIIERNYQDLTEPRRITYRLNIVNQMRGTTTVRGSSVEARRVFFEEERGYHLLMRGDTNRFNFNALYDIPIQYGILTKGITLNLTEIVDCLLQNNHLGQQIEQFVINRQHKQFNEELILHTAAHLLHKAIASISGVNEQELEYWYKIDTREVVVWERYEGGAGISEVFENTLRTNPIEVYQELLASVLCPIDLSEDLKLISPEQLRFELAQRWYLPESNELIVRVVEEAQAEHQAQTQQQHNPQENNQQQEETFGCRPPQGHDGCPACIHTTYCTERDNQDLSVSRIVGEAILRCFVYRINREDLETVINEAVTLNIQPPHIFFANPEQGVFDVLLL